MVSLFESDVCLSKRLAEYFCRKLLVGISVDTVRCTSGAVVLKKSKSLTLLLMATITTCLVDDFVKKMNERLLRLNYPILIL